MAVNQSIHNNLVYFAKPYIDDLRDRVKETVVLEVLFGEDMIMAYIAEGPQLIRIAGRIGDRVPVHAAAGAKAILAFSSPGTRSALLNVEMSRFTKQTITNPAVLEKQLNEIKQLGISFDNEEINEGTSAIGAPVFNHEKKPVASVVIAAPSRRIKNSRSQEMILMLKETAENISKKLYYRGPSS
jgi:IclR family acetate operon transcriptional repressor